MKSVGLTPAHLYCGCSEVAETAQPWFLAAGSAGAPWRIRNAGRKLGARLYVAAIQPQPQGPTRCIRLASASRQHFLSLRLDLFPARLLRRLQTRRIPLPPEVHPSDSLPSGPGISWTRIRRIARPPTPIWRRRSRIAWRRGPLTRSAPATEELCGGAAAPVVVE